MSKTEPKAASLKPKWPSPMQPEMRPLTLKRVWRVLLGRQDP
jgi:hypothetical protein